MRAGIALGSNLGDRLSALKLARTALLKIRGIEGPQLSSSLYETEPVASVEHAGAFLNAVVEVHFDGDPLELLQSLQSIEAQMGRPQSRPVNSPRIVDLDILYVGSLSTSAPRLVIPHPRLHLRRFVLQPLAEIRPDLLLPGHSKTVSNLLSELEDPAAVSIASQQWAPL